MLPQLVAVPQLNAQSTPALLGSLVTTALIAALELLTRTVLGGAGWKAILIDELSEDGAAGFLRSKVLPPPPQASETDSRAAATTD
jgi:hypothetical protein